MKVLRLFRTLAFQPPGQEVRRGPKARGTLVLGEDEERGLVVRYICDMENADPFLKGSAIELEIKDYDVVPAVPANQSVVVETREVGQYTWTAYRELPPAEVTQFTVVNLAVLRGGQWKVVKGE